MRTILALIIGVFVAAALVMAQSHDNTVEKIAKDTITFTTDVRIGNYVLPAGEYRVVCDKHRISFTPARGQSFAIDCKGQLLPEERKTTQTYTSVGDDGVRVLDRLYLRGSNVEHVFK